MKLNEVPKDDANALEGKTSFIQYAVDENGHYVQEKSPGFEPQNIALMNAWEDAREEIQLALTLVETRKKSPLFFFMKKELMDYFVLSDYMKLPKWMVWLHCKPYFFNKLKNNTLQTYCKVLNINNSSELINFEIDKWRKI